MRKLSILFITVLFLNACTDLTPLSKSVSDVAVVNIDDQHVLLNLSNEKWKWMADKDVTKLTPLFHERSKFVHMSGTWNKDTEIDIIKSGNIWYKNADVHDTAVEVFYDTGIVWSRITLIAVVGGNEVSNEFTVTEVYQKNGKNWQLLDMTFSNVRDMHKIAK